MIHRDTFQSSGSPEIVIRPPIEEIENMMKPSDDLGSKKEKIRVKFKKLNLGDDYTVKAINEAVYKEFIRKMRNRRKKTS